MQTSTNRVDGPVVQKGKGRPREFDEQQVLQAALEVFWEKGFADTSLDDLAEAMDMRRPSIYRSFGSKLELYRKALARYCDHLNQEIKNTLFAEPDVSVALTRFYQAALNVYTSGSHPKGCMLVSTASILATSEIDVRGDLRKTLKLIDAHLLQRFKQADDDGQLKGTTPLKTRAQIAHAVLQTIAIQARAGTVKHSLSKLAQGAVRFMVA